MQNRTGHLQIMRMENKKGDNKVRLYFHLRGRPRRVEREREREQKKNDGEQLFLHLFIHPAIDSFIATHRQWPTDMAAPARVFVAQPPHPFALIFRFRCV